MNNKAWICDKLEELVSKYEKRIEEIELNYGGWSESDTAEHATLAAIIDELKELLYK